MLKQKNKLKKLIFIGMLFFAAFAYISCGGNGAGDDDNSGGSNNSSSGSSYEPLSEEDVIAELNDLGDYVIGFTTSSDGETEDGYSELGRKGNIYWALYNGYGMAYVLDGENLHCYSAYENENYSWKYDLTMPADTIESSLESMNGGFLTGLTYASDIDDIDTFRKISGNEKVSGRSCTHYRGTVSYGPATSTTDIYVDNATGITMKVITTYIGGGVTNTSTFTVKTFKTGSSVTAPDLPEPEDF